MPVQRLLFMRTATIGGAAIRLVTWSRWSHVAVVTLEDTVVEAVAFHGVREITLKEALARATDYQIVETSCPNPFAAQMWARSQIGKPYDYTGALGLGLHREWDDPSAWWCSEHATAAMVAGGEVWFKRDMRRITPEHVWMVA